MTEKEIQEYIEKANNRDVTLDGGEVVKVLPTASIEELRGKLVYVYLTHIGGEELSITYRGEHFNKTLTRDEVELTGIVSQWFIRKDTAVFVGSDFFINASIKRILPSSDEYAQTYETKVLSSIDCVDSSNALDQKNIESLVQNLNTDLFYDESRTKTTTPYYRCKWCDTLHEAKSEEHEYFYCDVLCEEKFNEKKEIVNHIFKSTKGEERHEEETFIEVSSAGHKIIAFPEHVEDSAKNIEKATLDSIGYEQRLDFSREERHEYFKKREEAFVSLPASTVVPKYVLEIAGLGAVKAIVSYDMDNETGLQASVVENNYETTIWFQHRDEMYTLYGFDELNPISRNVLTSTFKAFLEYTMDQKKLYESNDGVESATNPNWLEEAQKAVDEHNVAEYTKLLVELDYVSDRAQPLQFQMMMEGAASMESSINRNQIFVGEK